MATWKKVIVSGSGISQLANDAGYLVNTGAGIVSASATGTSQGQIKLNGVDVNIKDLSTTSKPTFAAVTASLKGNVTGNVTGNLTGNVTGDLTGTSSFATIGGGLVAGALTNAMVDASAGIVYTKLDFNGSGFLSSSNQLGVRDSEISLTGSNGVTINGGASGAFTLNQASAEGFTISIPAGTVSGSANGANQGEVVINGIARSTGLKTTDSVTFATASVSNNLSVGGNIATVGNGTFGGDVTITGNLTTLGTVVNVNSTDLAIEDKFILLNSGSTAADSGIIVSKAAAGTGTALFYDNVAGRWASDFDGADAVNDTATADAHLAMVVTSADPNYAKAGNIRVDGTGDIFIYV